MKKISIILSLLLIIVTPVSIRAEENDIKQGEIYTTEKRIITSKARANGENDMPKEYIEDINSMNNIEYLKLKTNSNYEVALAYEDGSYSYLQSEETIENAIKVANNQKKKVKSNVIPVVISKDGLVVYATEAIGRIVKIVDGKAIEKGHEDYTKYTTKIYNRENSTYDIASLNHGFIDDAPIIQDNGKRVQVQVNGVIGWMDKQDEKGVNIISVPINQVNNSTDKTAKNLSYYTKNADGSLVHYISYDITSNTSSGDPKIIGVAPSFMKVGQKYYSYDAKYFYTDISDLLKDLQNTLDKDKTNDNEKSINKTNPFYNYYTYVPARHKTSYSVEEINKYIEEFTESKSVLRNKGKALVDAQNKYGMSANMILGIAMNESARGISDKAIKQNNIFGLRVYDDGSLTGDTYKSVEECIDNFGSGWMSNWYLNPNYSKYSGSNLGNKDGGINVRYAADPYWGEKAAGFMYEMDRYISGIGTLIEYNKHNIGILTSKGNITKSNGETLYYIVEDRSMKDPDGKGNRNAKVGEPVLVLSQSATDVDIYPDRQVPYSASKPVTYDWGMNGKVNTSNVNVLNNKENKTRNFNNFTVNNNFDITSTQVTGKGPYDATVKVLKDGKQIGSTVKIGTSESYKVEIPKQKPGVKLVVEINKSGYNKANKSITVLNKFSSFAVNSIDSKSTTITGKGMSGATVKAYVGNSQIGNTATVNSSGNYSITIPAKGANTTIVVKMSKTGYVTSQKSIKVIGVTSGASKKQTNDIYRYDAGKGNYLTYVNGKGYSQYSYLNKAGDYAFTPSSWMKAAGLSVSMPTSKNGYTMTIDNNYVELYNDANSLLNKIRSSKIAKSDIEIELSRIQKNEKDISNDVINYLEDELDSEILQGRAAPKKTLRNDIYRYDLGKGKHLTYINGKGYSQYSYLNTNGDYAFTPSSWMKAAGLTVTMPISNNGYTMKVDNPYIVKYNNVVKEINNYMK